jgi:hypothetical protein
MMESMDLPIPHPTIPPSIYRVVHSSFNFGIFLEICRFESMNSIDVVLQGIVLKEPNGKKSYLKEKSIRWNVNTDDFRMDVLIDELSVELRVGGAQCITARYFIMIMAHDVILTQNDEFRAMFDMNIVERKLALASVMLDNPCLETPVPMPDIVSLCMSQQLWIMTCCWLGFRCVLYLLIRM